MVLYEIFTFGKVPYVGLTNAQVLDEVPAGRRLPQPRHCPDAIFELMRQAFNVDDRQRPTFVTLEACLRDIRDRLRQAREDADLHCSRASPISRYSSEINTDFGTVSSDKKRRRSSGRNRALRAMAERVQAEGAESAPTGPAATQAEVDGYLAPTGTLPSGAQMSPNPPMQRTGSTLSRSSSVITFEGGYMLMEGELGRMDNFIVLDPDGLDTQLLSDSEGPQVVRQAIAQTADKPEKGKGGKIRKAESAAAQPAAAAAATDNWGGDDDGNLPPVVLRTVHNGAPMYLTVNPDQLAPEMLEALLGDRGRAQDTKAASRVSFQKKFLGLATEASS